MLVLFSPASLPDTRQQRLNGHVSPFPPPPPLIAVTWGTQWKGIRDDAGNGRGENEYFCSAHCHGHLRSPPSGLPLTWVTQQEVEVEVCTDYLCVIIMWSRSKETHHWLLLLGAREDHKYGYLNTHRGEQYRASVFCSSQAHAYFDP